MAVTEAEEATELRAATANQASTEPTEDLAKTELTAKADVNLKLEVTFGPTIGNRVILAGIASGFNVDEPHTGRVIVGQKIVAVLNLEPRAMMGIDSHGMLLATHDEQDRIWLVNPGPSPDGTEVG